MQCHFDYAKLRKRIRDKCGTQETFARNAGFTIVELASKLGNVTDFTLCEMDRTCDLLGIGDEDVEAFFFSIE